LNCRGESFAGVKLLRKRAVPNACICCRHRECRTRLFHVTLYEYSYRMERAAAPAPTSRCTRAAVRCVTTRGQVCGLASADLMENVTFTLVHFLLTTRYCVRIYQACSCSTTRLLQHLTSRSLGHTCQCHGSALQQLRQHTVAVSANLSYDAQSCI
jgi:hypothetical protein